MSDCLLRLAEPADAAAISSLVRQAYAPYVQRIGREPAPMTADYEALIGHARVWVLQLDDRLVGALVTRNMRDHLLLENIAVAPDVQRRGFGRLLLDRADGDALEQGLDEVRLYTNEAMTENLAYYPGRGYRETGRATQDGFSRVFFTKRLDSGSGRATSSGDEDAERMA